MRYLPHLGMRGLERTLMSPFPRMLRLPCLCLVSVRRPAARVGFIAPQRWLAPNLVFVGENPLHPLERVHRGLHAVAVERLADADLCVAFGLLAVRLGPLLGVCLWTRHYHPGLRSEEHTS